jgi:hypothetical protein
VPHPFSISRARYEPLPNDDLRREIRSHTGSDAEADGILRSIERFGGDASIDSYEVTPRAPRGGFRRAATVAWSVRAIRSAHSSVTP